MDAHPIAPTTPTNASPSRKLPLAPAAKHLPPSSSAHMYLIDAWGQSPSQACFPTPPPPYSGSQNSRFELGDRYSLSTPPAGPSNRKIPLLPFTTSQASQISFDKPNIGYLKTLSPQAQYDIAFGQLQKLHMSIDAKIDSMQAWVDFVNANRSAWTAAGLASDELDDRIQEFENEISRLSRKPEDKRRAAGTRQLLRWLNDMRGYALCEELVIPFMMSGAGAECRISNDGVRSIREFFETRSNTSWELCELVNWVKLRRWCENDLRDYWTPADTNFLRSYLNITKNNRPPPTGKADFKLIRDPSILARSTPSNKCFEYSRAGLLHIVDVDENCPTCNMWPTPPTFLGEEHLEVIRFYENGGSASNRVLIVGPIEKKAEGQRTA
ncbi:hypothetical protein DID88_001026 [Monilinia fructigena]|uniref:Uncharacterized protein n=1 Tax=Monilinia fructigena TaxID=38457 RepID=A0A395IYY1_9HELO|nr:hypothetical protein DID88_001026 [Monilinia fructigena]